MTKRKHSYQTRDLTIYTHSPSTFLPLHSLLLHVRHGRSHRLRRLVSQSLGHLLFAARVEEDAIPVAQEGPLALVKHAVCCVEPVQEPQHTVVHVELQVVEVVELGRRKEGEVVAGVDLNERETSERVRGSWAKGVPRLSTDP